MRHFGVRLSFPQGEKVVITLPEIRPEHRGGLGTSAVNGVIISALFASARMYDAAGQVCARCQGVVKLSRMKWASGESPAIN